jgi:alkylation response protein AidB-like acyl-CoA dehydrogenase
MKLTYDTHHQALQCEVQAFLAEHWQPEHATDAAFVANFRLKAVERGYLYRGIPRRFGGSEQSPDVVAAQIISEAFVAHRAPQEVPGIGMMMLVPVLLECGTEWQKEKFIPKTVTGEYRWAQGYSEPGSGSDLASLRTRGVLEDNEWVINGHKIWTTRAHEANFMFALVRTEPDAPKHEGLSYLLLDFKQQGVTVKPIKQISGELEFSEVFLDDVRTPADWIVGERGKGWSISKVNLKHERSAVGSAARSQALFRSLLSLARSTRIDGRPAIEDPAVRERIAMVEGYVKAQLYAGYYQTTLASRGDPAGVLGLCSKLNNTNIGQMISGIASDIAAEALLRLPAEKGKVGNERWFRQVMGSLGLSIAGGASNIQRNIIAERGLGLPRTAGDA